MKRTKGLVWQVELLLFYVFSFPLSLIPHMLIKKTGAALGLLVYFLWKKRRLIAIENLRTAIERNAISTKQSPEEIIKECFKNLGKSFIEILKVYYGRGNKILSSVSIEGKENFKKAKAKGKGIIFVTGHTGNWELMSIVVALNVDKLGVVARHLNNPYLNRVVEAMRSKYGNRVIYKKGALREILRTMKAGGNVGLLIDQAVIPEEGIIIEFLKMPAWTLKVPALIARMSTASVLPIFIRRTDRGHLITISPEVTLSGDEVEDTKRLTRSIEDYVKENPSEWLWIHRRWKRAGTAHSE